jgi:hypothetical protein
MKEAPRKVYKSMQGREVELDRLIARNETTPAVGNIRVNARGDTLGPGGKIVANRDATVPDYYRPTRKGNT